MKESKDIIACVCDHGQFVAVARKLGEQVKKCYYWSPHEKSLRLIQEGIIGDGFDEIERVDDIWGIKYQCDLFVFPDIGFSGLQKELIGQGFPVWGARDSDTLESNRGKFLKTLKELEMEVPTFKTIKGMTNLRLHLKDEDDKYIKISHWRGNFETFHWVDWKNSEVELDNLAVEFGPAKEHVMFYVFDPIDTEIEDGIDAYCIDGKYPEIVMHGMECKDKSYIGCMTDWDDLPEQVRTVNEEFAPALVDYRGFFCTEVRITDEGKNYFIDPTCRAPSPPHQLMTELFENFADIIWQGANGNCIDPVPAAKFGVQALLSGGGDGWSAFTIDKSIESQVKTGFCCQIDDRLVFPPHQLGSMCGYLTGIGDTMEDAIGSLQDAAKKLPDGMKCEDKSIAELLKEVKSAEEKGMEFSDDKIPEPSIVIDA